MKYTIDMKPFTQTLNEALIVFFQRIINEINEESNKKSNFHS